MSRLALIINCGETEELREARRKLQALGNRVATVDVNSELGEINMCVARSIWRVKVDLCDMVIIDNTQKSNKEIETLLQYYLDTDENAQIYYIGGDGHE